MHWRRRLLFACFKREKAGSTLMRSTFLSALYHQHSQEHNSLITQAYRGKIPHLISILSGCSL
jgi:hypothetical protein